MTYKTNTPPSGGVNCLFVSETLSLLADEFGIVEVVDAHRLTNLIHRLGTNLAGLFRTLLKNIVNLRNILLEPYHRGHHDGSDPSVRQGSDTLARTP